MCTYLANSMVGILTTTYQVLPIADGCYHAHLLDMSASVNTNYCDYN